MRAKYIIGFFVSLFFLADYASAEPSPNRVIVLVPNTMATNLSAPEN
jgi:hypothetical protein